MKDALQGKHVSFLWLILLSLIFASFAFGYDEVTLKNGQVIRGKIVKDDEAGIVIEVTQGGEGEVKLSQVFSKDQVASVSIEEPKIYSNARRFQDSKKYIEAIKAYQEVIEGYSKYKWAESALFHMGECYERLKDWKNSKESYENFLKNYPKSEFYLKCQMGLANSLLMQGMHSEALKIYESMLNMAKGEMAAQVHYGIGEANLAQKRFEEALEQGYLKIVVLDYEFPEWVAKAMLKSGDCFTYLGDIRRATYYYKEVLKKEPDSAHAREAKEKLKPLTLPSPTRGED